MKYCAINFYQTLCICNSLFLFASASLRLHASAAARGLKFTCLTALCRKRCLRLLLCLPLFFSMSAKLRQAMSCCSPSLCCFYVRAAVAAAVVDVAVDVAVAVAVVVLLLLRAFSFSQLSSRRTVLVCSGNNSQSVRSFVASTRCACI